MRITNSTAYNTPVVVTLAPAVAASPRVATKVSSKELKIERDSAEILNVPAVAALMGVTPATVREMCRRGAIPARKILSTNLNRLAHPVFSRISFAAWVEK